jgi:lysozyme
VSRAQIRAQLFDDEGLRLKPYVDTEGKVTIGVGRNLTDRGISRGQAMTWFDEDIDEAEHWLIRQCPWALPLDPPRYAVLVNMRFNLGPIRFLGFARMLSALQLGDYERAAAEMLDSRWAEQVGPRAQRLATQMRTGTWPAAYQGVR